jgi:prepilin-type processing-associated H-X9-DG protein
MQTAYELPAKSSRFSKAFTWTVGILLLLIVLMTLMVSACGGGMGRPSANRAKSSSNLHQIGLALTMYSNADSLGRFAPDLPTLLRVEQLSPDVFVAPSANDIPALGATSAEQAANLMKGDHESYSYVGAALKSDAPNDAVALYEPPSINRNTGGNVLFGDGHVVFLDEPAIDQIVQMDKSGTRPIYWPPHPTTRP